MKRLLIGIGLLCLVATGAQSFWQSRLQVSVAGAGCTFARIDFTTGSLGAATLTRAGSGTYINVSGVLSTAATNVARFNYDANYPGGNVAPSLTGPFLLVEPASTNLILESNTFGTTWSAINGAAVTPNTFVSPDGTSDGWTITTGNAFAVLQGLNSLSAAPYIVSVWDKSISGASNGYIFTLGGSSTNSGNPLPVTSTIIRYSGTLTAGSGFNNTFLFASGVSGSNGIFAAQVEPAAASGYFSTHPSSYMATTTASVARAADVVAYTQSSGCNNSVFTFDDNTTQTVGCAPGSCTVPAATINRPNLKFIDGTAWLLNRDLGNAANDNNPVGMERAA